MTPLTKPLSREIRLPGFNRPIIITLDPAGRIIFHEKGCRNKYPAAITALYAFAVKGKA